MAFTKKDWQDYPDTSTPITAAALEDLETRLAAYAELSVSGASDKLAGGAETIARKNVFTQGVQLGSGQVRIAYFTAPSAATPAKFISASGTTAAGATPTLCRMGLYTIDGSGNLTLVARTASDTSLWANTAAEYERAFDTASGFPSSYALSPGTRYACGLICVTSFTAPTCMGVSTLPSATTSRNPAISKVLGSQTDLPLSISAGSLSNSGQVPYVGMVP